MMVARPAAIARHHDLTAAPDPDDRGPVPAGELVVRHHLPPFVWVLYGFARTIPMFLMAYGDRVAERLRHSVDDTVTTVAAETGTDLGDLVTQAATTIDEQQFSIGFETVTETGSVADLGENIRRICETTFPVVGCHPCWPYIMRPS